MSGQHLTKRGLEGCSDVPCSETAGGEGQGVGALPIGAYTSWATSSSSSTTTNASAILSNSSSSSVGINANNNNSTDSNNNGGSVPSARPPLEIIRDVVLIFLAGMAIVIGLMIFTYLLTLLVNNVRKWMGYTSPRHHPHSNHRHRDDNDNDTDDDNLAWPVSDGTEEYHTNNNMHSSSVAATGRIVIEAGLRGMTSDERRQLLHHLLVPTIYHDDGVLPKQVSDKEDTTEDAVDQTVHVTTMRAAESESADDGEATKLHVTSTTTVGVEPDGEGGDRSDIDVSRIACQEDHVEEGDVDAVDAPTDETDTHVETLRQNCHDVNNVSPSARQGGDVEEGVVLVDAVDLPTDDTNPQDETLHQSNQHGNDVPPNCVRDDNRDVEEGIVILDAVGTSTEETDPYDSNVVQQISHPNVDPEGGPFSPKTRTSFRQTTSSTQDSFLDDESMSGDNNDPQTCCSICLSKYHDGDALLQSLQCRHCFHYDCCMEWLEKKDVCPYCRAPMFTANQLRDAAMIVLGHGRLVELKHQVHHHSRTSNDSIYRSMMATTSTTARITRAGSQRMFPSPTSRSTNNNATASTTASALSSTDRNIFSVDV